MAQIIVDGQEMAITTPVALPALIDQVEPNLPRTILAAKVNNELHDLTREINDGDRVELLGVGTEDGNRIYRRSLTFVLIRAVKELFPDGEVTIEHSLSKGLYCELHIGRTVEPQDITRIRDRMRQIIKDDQPFTKHVLPKGEAMTLFRRQGQEDKVRLLAFRPSPVIHVYQLGWLYDYFYSYMVPSTGYLSQFDLIPEPPGCLLRFPTKESPDAIPEHVPSPKLFTIFRESERWADILEVGDVPALNSLIQKGQGQELIHVAEALHEKKIAQIADEIAHRGARIVLIAGPSSSGKTTFAQRLRIQLRVNGLRPVTIGLDDYFVDREHTPRDESGKWDFEALEAIDIALFNLHLKLLLAGEDVQIPTFNFFTGKREQTGHALKIEPDQPILIEGIHGLNERLSASIPREQKFKIYISALTQLNLDHHNRVPTTDARVLRRVVRDNQFRGHSALRTLETWPSVRRGEEANIFPFQEEADAMFNSHLVYELAVLKCCAEPLLAEIGPEQTEYAEARRLGKFLSYFLPLEPDAIPTNSIIREFIGGSVFH